MINLDDSKYQVEFKDVSFDRANQISMIESSQTVIDFDAVKNDYTKDFGLKKTPKSNDALIKRDDQFYFIEFKSGRVNKHDIMKKIYDSLLILMDIIGEGITFTRGNVSFVLVYDYEKNKKEISKEIDKRSKEANKLEKKEIQSSTGFTDIAKNLSSLAKIDFDPFNIAEDFEKIYLRDVKSYEVDKFEELFVSEY